MSDARQALRDAGFTSYVFPPDDAPAAVSASHAGARHDVWAIGTGPPVIVLHELPGFAQPLVNFALRLCRAGFRVHLPHLFGDLMRESSKGNALRLTCIRGEFGKLKAGVSSPITSYLRALAVHVAEREGGCVGAIGMCLTGAFVIPMIIEPCVRGAVAAQPSVPFSTLYALTRGTFGGGGWMSQLNVSDADIAAARDRLRRDRLQLLALRCSGDVICPREKLERFGTEFEPHVELIELRVPRRKKPLHSTLTSLYDEADAAGDPSEVGPEHDTRYALQRVIDYLRANLGGAA